MDKLKIKLEDILLEAGVQIIYSFRPIDISKDSDYIKVAIVLLKVGGR